jgi:phospholipid/cholesterol/gamma-HCH transport system ATP-binding protein
MDLSKKLGVTSVVVTHEMDSAFTIADRMAMLDKGRMLMVDTREAFQSLRDHPAERVHDLTETQQLIRQFLRGDAEGPITRRKTATNYAEDLLGEMPPMITQVPAVEPTRHK